MKHHKIASVSCTIKDLGCRVRRQGSRIKSDRVLLAV
jgi:hypothetical protein